MHLELDDTSEKIYLADIKIIRKVRVLDFREESLSNDILSALIYSSLLSAPATHEGWNKPEYIFSRFVSDCVISVRIDGIRYPTTRASDGYNLVLFNLDNDWNTLIKVVSITEFDAACE